MMNISRRLRIVALVITICAAGVPAWAQGYGLYEQSACAMGRAGAGVAQPCDDGSAMVFNPAGLTALTSTILTTGATAVAPRGRFTNDSTGLVSPLNERTFLVPTIYFAVPIRRRVIIGVGVFAPYGLTSDWPATTEGRFLGYFSSLKSIYVQPTFALRLNDRVSFGAGMDVTRTSVELRRRLDLATLPVPGAPAGVTFRALGVPLATDFADLDLTGNGMSVGGHFGVIVKANDRLSIGARFLLRQQAEINNGQLATAQIPTGLRLAAPLAGVPAGTPIDGLLAPLFVPGSPLGPQSSTTALPLPSQLVGGLALRPGRNITLLVDYQFTTWSLFDRLVIQNQFAPATTLVEDFRNTHGIRLGVERRFGDGATLRAGFDGHTAGAPDQSVTPILPEAPRREYTVGATLRVARHLKLDLAYQFVNQEDRAGRTTDGGLAAPTPAVNNGVFHYYANLLGASLVFNF